MGRLNSSLESAGAEFLVLGHLLIEGIEAHKLYTNFPGYDLLAASPEKSTTCRIQVKSRWATDFDGGFPIKNFGCDFVVFVALNRGFRYRRKVTENDTGRRQPQLYVFPVDLVRKAQKSESSWGKVFLRHIDSPKQYLSGWGAIREFLEVDVQG